MLIVFCVPTGLFTVVMLFCNFTILLLLITILCIFRSHAIACVNQFIINRTEALMNHIDSFIEVSRMLAFSPVDWSPPPMSHPPTTYPLHHTLPHHTLPHHTLSHTPSHFFSPAHFYLSHFFPSITCSCLALLICRTCFGWHQMRIRRCVRTFVVR